MRAAWAEADNEKEPLWDALKRNPTLQAMSEGGGTRPAIIAAIAGASQFVVRWPGLFPRLRRFPAEEIEMSNNPRKLGNEPDPDSTNPDSDLPHQPDDVEHVEEEGEPLGGNFA
ncbi:MAG: hypothetical protein V4459_06120 [Pseudomonadota bacterium]